MFLLKEHLRIAEEDREREFPPPRRPNPFPNPAHIHAKPSLCFTPVSWNQYFQSKQKIATGEHGEEHFSIYCASTERFVEGRLSPMVILIHGGGHSALTWAKTVEALLKFMACDIMAVDLRGHGETKMNNEENLSTEVLTQDLVRLTLALELGNRALVIVGHSLGGAVAIHFANEMKRTKEMAVVALVVIDVVEGSAMDSLASMNSVLKSRPEGFPTLARAIEWSYRTGQAKNLESARVAMPGQLKFMDTNEPATVQAFENLIQVKSGETRAPTTLPVRTKPVKSKSYASTSAAIKEDEVMAAPRSMRNLPESSKAKPSPYAGFFTWRTNLLKTETFWADWFKGISSKFMDLSCPKLLLLAGIDRLDRELTVGQMQGKFQVHVLQNVGHVVQEDNPELVAHYIAGFVVRHKLAIGNVTFKPLLPGC